MNENDHRPTDDEVQQGYADADEALSGTSCGQRLVVLHYAEMDSLADVHERLAVDAILEGRGEDHDKHECRAFELRRLALVARAAAEAGRIA